MCRLCGEWKQLELFHKSRNRDGRDTACKACAYARVQALRKKKQARPGKDHIPPHKQCAKCGATKPSESFAVYRAANDGLGRYCRECDNAHSRSRRYGMPEARVRIMAARASCEVCGSKFANSKHQHFDHRHSDGAVRGVLCFRCNGLVGDCLESPEILLAVAAYLRRTADVDYRVQPYGVTKTGETDTDSVGARQRLSPEVKATCQTKQRQN